MKKSITFLSLLCTLNLSAQINSVSDETKSSIKFKREYCILDNENATNTRCAATQDKAQLRAIGSPKILVCLANYADVKFTVANDNDSLIALFDTFFNGKGIGVGQNPHSVYDYFNEMSNGIFTPEFIITEPVTLSKERAYYGNKNGGYYKNYQKDNYYNKKSWKEEAVEAATVENMDAE